MISYWPCADFYYSGHVAISTCLIAELLSYGDRIGYWVGLIIMVNEAFMLIFVRTHYVIDLVGGYICANYFSRLSEPLCFVWDVWVCGLPAYKRDNYYFKSCPRCGWSNNYACMFVDQREQEA